MSGERHNVIGMTIGFDIGRQAIAFEVRMHKNPGLNVIRERAQQQGLLNPDNHVQAAISAKLRGVKITLSGPTLEQIYRAIPLGVQLNRRQANRLTLPQVDGYITAFYQVASPSLPRPRLNATNLMRLVALLCA